MKSLDFSILDLAMAQRYLVTEGLRRVVDDDDLGEVTPQNIEILHVVAPHAHAVLSKQSMPESRRH